jgi:hypothetical protein
MEKWRNRETIPASSWRNPGAKFDVRTGQTRMSLNFFQHFIYEILNTKVSTELCLWWTDWSLRVRSQMLSIHWFHNEWIIITSQISIEARWCHMVKPCVHLHLGNTTIRRYGDTRWHGDFSRNCWAGSGMVARKRGRTGSSWHRNWRVARSWLTEILDDSDRFWRKSSSRLTPLFPS